MTAARQVARPPRRPTVSGHGGWTSWTPARQERIVAAILQGAYIEVAARAAGLSYETFRRWMVLGRDRTELDEATGEQFVVAFAAEPFRGFRVAVEEAEAVLEVEAGAIAYQGAVAQANSATAPNAAGMLSLMSRRFRKRWALTVAAEVSGPDRGPIEADLGDPAERLAGVLEALARAGVVILPTTPQGAAGRPARPIG